MMGGSEQAQLVGCQPFEAPIARRRVNGELSLGQPAAQGFGINGKQTTTVGQRNEGHGTTPFVLPLTRTIQGPADSWEFSADRS